jgi:AraC-like DNA-binding protein
MAQPREPLPGARVVALSAGRASIEGVDRLRQLRLAKDAMDRDWADPDLDLDAVAAHAGYSRYHFVRTFKEVYGRTPGQYLSYRRTERAEELLRTADLSVTEICHLVGFTSLGTFSSRFKTQTGLTPSEYRAKHVGRGSALIPGCYVMLWARGFPTPVPVPGEAGSVGSAASESGGGPGSGSVPDSEGSAGRGGGGSAGPGISGR